MGQEGLVQVGNNMYTIFDYITDAIFWLIPGVRIYDKTFFLFMFASVVVSIMMGDFTYAVFSVFMLVVGIVIDIMFPDIYKSRWFNLIELIIFVAIILYFIETFDTAF